MCFLLLIEKGFWLEKTKTFELPKNVLVLKWMIGTADVKIDIYCGKFTPVVWQGIHHTSFLSRTGKDLMYFSRKIFE